MSEQTPRGCTCAKPGEVDPACVAHGLKPSVCWNCLGTGTVKYRQGGPHGIDQGMTRCPTCRGSGLAKDGGRRNDE